MSYTHEQKELFFAQYWGQTVKRSYLPEQTSLAVVNHNVFHISHLIINGYLELKSLNDLTQDDMLEMFKILTSSDEDLNYLIEAINDGEITIEDIVKPFSDINFDVADNTISPIRVFWAGDFLRSKGYAIPFGGFTLDQMLSFGWLKYSSI